MKTFALVATGIVGFALGFKAGKDFIQYMNK